MIKLNAKPLGIHISKSIILSVVNVVQDLPDTIHVGGRITPTTVWDYVGKLKTSLSKVCLEKSLSKCLTSFF